MNSDLSLPSLKVELYDQPDTTLTSQQQAQLSDELRTLASACLSPVPNYNVLALPTSLAFHNKLLLTARSPATGELLAFVSALLLHEVDPTLTQHLPADQSFLLHTGLTCVAPALRRSGVTILLFHRLFTHMVTVHPAGFWITSLAAIPSSLASLAKYAINVFPSPYFRARPSATHLKVALAIASSERCREEMLVSKEAMIEQDTFVFRGSNAAGSPFRKEGQEAASARDHGVDAFYRQMLRKDNGDEVLQVGFLNKARMEEIARAEKNRFAAAAKL